MAQAQLPEWARSVLEVDEERFKELVRELARSTLLTPYYIRRNNLAYADIILGRVRPDERRYSIVADVPLCRHNYGDGRGVFYVDKHGIIYLSLGFRCAADRTNESGRTALAAYIWSGGEVIAEPWMLYNTLRMWPSTDVKPLLDLAKKAEQEGDKELAGVLKKLYAILEASKDIVKEIEEADYSQVKVEVDEREVERKVEEAVKLLREAKELARKGDIDNLNNLLSRSMVIKAPLNNIWLYDVLYYLDTGEGRVKDLLDTYNPERLGKVLKEADIYDVLITAAEHFGLEVRR